MSSWCSSPNRISQFWNLMNKFRNDKWKSMDISLSSSCSNDGFLEPSQRKNCSATQSIFNGFNALCGIALLSTPFAIKEGGWFGIFYLFVFGAISCYTGILLKRCLDTSPRLHSYPDIGQAVFGTAGRLVVAACAVEYIILMSDNISSLFPNVELHLFRVHLDSHFIFSILMTLIVLPTVWLQNISLLSYLSAGGVVATILVILCMLWVGAVDQVGFHQTSGTTLDLKNMPIALGLYSACYTGHAVFPNIYTSMKKPSQYPVVVFICFATCGVLYTLVAVCGYLMFGDSTKSQFTLNMPHRFVSSKIAVWTTVINPLSKYALNIYPIAEAVEKLVSRTQPISYCKSITIRTTLVLSSLVISLSVPFFGFVLALIGSFSTILVAHIMPCACYLSILPHRLSRLEIGVNIDIIVVGVACSGIGSYAAVARIVQQILKTQTLNTFKLHFLKGLH